MGRSYKSYYQVLYDGATKLLKRTTRKVILQEDRREGYNGYYQEKEAYFIKRKTGRLASIELTKRSVQKTLADELKRSRQSLPEGELSVETIIKILRSSGEK